MKAITVWLAGGAVLVLVWVIAQQMFYAAAGEAHGWRPWYERWNFPNWRETRDLFRQTFQRQEDPAAEHARRRYAAMSAALVLWGILGPPITVLVFGG